MSKSKKSATPPPVEGHTPSQETSADHIERAREIFAQHKADTIWFTSDGTAFLHPQFARIHSDGLKDKSIVTIKRQEV